MTSESGIKIIATNSHARAKYHFEEVVEAGLVLQGTEIKSLRQTTPELKESYVEIRGSSATNSKTSGFEAFLVQCHIAPYTHGNIWNHEPLRPRKLLLHRKQLERLQIALTREGRTIIPTRMYFSKGRAKIELAISKGKKTHDRREDVQRREHDREMERALKRRNR